MELILKIYRMKIINIIFIITFILFLNGCKSEDDFNPEKFYARYAVELENELDENVSLIAFKQNLAIEKVKIVLLNYWKFNDNYSYQILTLKKIDYKKEMMMDSIKPKMIELIPQLAQESQLSNQDVGKIIYDYRILNYEEQMNSLYDRLDDIEMSIEYRE